MFFVNEKKKHLKEKQKCFGLKNTFCWEVDHRHRVDFEGGEAMTFTSTLVKI